MSNLEVKMLELHGKEWKAKLLKSLLAVTVDIANNPEHAEGVPQYLKDAINDLYAIAEAIE